MSTTSNLELGIETPDSPEIISEPRLSVYVVFTAIDSTLKALEKARDMARFLGARILLLAVQVVPFPLQLNKPPVSMEFVISRFEEKAGDLSENAPVSVYLCRDQIEAFKCILNRNSPVVIGATKHWWPTRDERLARKLRRAGYDVILARTE